MNKVTMLTEWKPYPEMERKVMRAIKEHFDGREIVTHKETIPPRIRTRDWYTQLMGLPYTSSSKVAALWANCNVNVYFDMDKQWRYTCFCIGTDGNVYALLWDHSSPEQEIYFKI